MAETEHKHSPGFLKLAEDAKTRIREISIDETWRKLQAGESFEFVDVREDNEWAAGHAAGARHIGRGVLERDVEALITDPNREIVLYCGGGYRSALAADNLQKMGYGNVRSLAGGIRGWRKQGLPEQKPPAEPPPSR
jgi:rhodanese-related sulfurtransferase